MPKTKITQGSGNVFADIGVQDPEGALAKAKVALTINRIISSLGLTQKQAGDILGIDQPRVSALSKGRLSVFSLEKLLSFSTKLGSGVEIKLGTQNSGINVVDAPRKNPCHHPVRLYGSPSILAFTAGAGVSSTMPVVFTKDLPSGNTASPCPAWLAEKLKNVHCNYNPNG